MNKMVMPLSPVSFDLFSSTQRQLLCCFFVKASKFTLATKKFEGVYAVKHKQGHIDKSLIVSKADEKKFVQKKGNKEHHFWHKRDSAGSGQKALNLVRNISSFPIEKEAVYGALDKWIAWETEFPLIAASKALTILRKRSQWKQVIQVAKWMLSKGQGATMATYDCLLLAFDMDGRVDEAETLWNMILHVHERSISKRLFSRMTSLFDHHNMPNKVIEVFADMEELGVKPDEDTLRRIARAFKVLGQEDKQKQVIMKYQSKWKYIHFNGERVRVHAMQNKPALIRNCDVKSSVLKNVNRLDPVVNKAFKVLNQEDMQRRVIMKHQNKWKYIHFNGERVRVRNSLSDL